MTELIDFGGRRYEAIDLSQCLSNATAEFEPMPHSIDYIDHGSATASTEERYGLGAEYWPKGEAWAFERVTLTTHSGTHIDAPYHYAPLDSGGKPARTIENVPLQWVMSDAFVLEMMSIDRKLGITEADVRAELERIEYEPKENDIALVRTDTSEHFGERGYDLLHAGLRREATAFLVASGVRLIGIDAWGLDRPMDIMAAEAHGGDRTQLWESHKFGAEQEYSQIEKLTNLSSIPRAHGFQVLALPVSLSGASGAWARVVALLEQ